MNFAPSYLDYIKEKSNSNIEKILCGLGANADRISYNSGSYQMPCFLHGGDSPYAFSYSTNKLCWKCFSRNCNEEFGSNIFGLVRSSRRISFIDSIRWLENSLGLKENNIKVDDEDIEIYHLIQRNKKINEDISSIKPIPINELNIQPSKYFKDIGFSDESIKKYHMGFCNIQGKPLYNRNFITVVDEDGSNAIGFSGRTIYSKCTFCLKFHKYGCCPDIDNKFKAVGKWKHIGINSGSVLFNEYYAKLEIEKTGVAVICEGPKNSVFLDQCGLFNSVATFGLQFSNIHIQKLISLGARTIVLLRDNDEAGISASENEIIKLQSFFRVFSIENKLKIGTDVFDEENRETLFKEIIPFVKSL